MPARAPHVTEKGYILRLFSSIEKLLVLDKIPSQGTELQENQ